MTYSALKKQVLATQRLFTLEEKMKKKLKAILNAILITVAIIVILGEGGYILYLARQCAAYEEMNARSEQEIYEIFTEKTKQLSHESFEHSLTQSPPTYVGIEGEVVNNNEDFPKLLWK